MKRLFRVTAMAALLSQSSVARSADSNYQTIADEAWRTAESVIKFQPFLAQAVEFKLQKGQQIYQGKLINLNRHLNLWHVIELQPAGGKGRTLYFNLENSLPASQQLDMTPDGVLVLNNLNNKGGNPTPCPLFGETDSDQGLLKATNNNPYVSLCRGRVFLRTQQQGNRLNILWSKDSEGAALPWDYEEGVVSMAKEYLFGSPGRDSSAAASPVPPQQQRSDAPGAAKVSRASTIPAYNTGIVLAAGSGKELTAGQWYKAEHHDGVFLSLMQPRLVDQEILNSFRDRVAPISGSEGGGVVVSMAMDLSKYSVGWNGGTDQPLAGWSPRAHGVKRLPAQGPDGFNLLRPELAFPGVVPPLTLPKVVGTFAGGFQRKDSAFKWGPLRGFNKGHHYGLMEKGVLMSALVPNLATFITYRNGDIDLKTWRKEDSNGLDRIRDARQNGVALIENGEPSPLVRQSGAGNWFASAKIEMETPRSSACIVKQGDHRYLMVSYFSSHTPNAMARVLQSYGCDYAMQFDMNGLKLAYAALFQRDDKGGFATEHLFAPMKGEDVSSNGMKAPRSIVTPNYKDFFYILKK